MQEITIQLFIIIQYISVSKFIGVTDITYFLILFTKHIDLFLLSPFTSLQKLVKNDFINTALLKLFRNNK